MPVGSAGTPRPLCKLATTPHEADPPRALRAMAFCALLLLQLRTEAKAHRDATPSLQTLQGQTKRKVTGALRGLAVVKSRWTLRGPSTLPSQQSRCMNSRLAGRPHLCRRGGRDATQELEPTDLDTTTIAKRLSRHAIMKGLELQFDSRLHQRC